MVFDDEYIYIQYYSTYILAFTAKFGCLCMWGEKCLKLESKDGQIEEKGRS